MESRIKGQISVHVSLILFLIDDYTGKRISDRKSTRLNSSHDN